MKAYRVLYVLMLFLVACGGVEPTPSPVPTTIVQVEPSVSPATSTAAVDVPTAAVALPTATLTSPAPTIVPPTETVAPAGLEFILEDPSDPIAVQVTADAERQVEALIPVAGGSLSATAADGTQFALDIPADALLEDTLIRMIPVRTIDGMPFGSESYAVQLEPEGLQFYQAAVLTIAPSAELPIDQQIFFGYQGQGENLALAAPVVSSQEIQIQILHFSGYGVTKGLLADVEPVRARIGGDAEARIQSALAEELMRARQEQLLGVENGTEVDWESYFQQYEEQVVKPRIAAAGESCAAGQLALQTALGYERQRQLLGVGEESAGSTLVDSGLMDTVADVCLKEEYELCRDDHIIHRIIPVWLGMERQYALLGLSEGGARPAALEKAKQYASRCLSFELQFHSEGTFTDGGGGGYDSVVDSKVKIQFNADKLDMRGQAPLVNTAFTFKVPTCSVTSNRGGNTFEAISLAYISDTKSPSDELGYVRDFKLIYYPGNTTETFTVKCPDSPAYTSPPTPHWTGIYLVTHQAEMSQADGGFVAEGWEVTGGEFMAKKEWITESAGDGVVEVGTLKLYHKPQ